jgi:hypothetical protein
MPRRTTLPPPKAADWSLERTLSALKRQLAALDTFGGRSYADADHDEEEWTNLTLNILTHGFGADSNNVMQFQRAKSAGDYYMGGMSPRLLQQNFEQRLKAFSATLRSSIAELELSLPEPALAGAYDSGNEYQFYIALKTIVGFATKELFITDNYLDTQLFDIYVENVAPAISVRVMTNKVDASLNLVAGKFANSRTNFELRSSKDVHDRVVFADDRCWVIGQSIKDAAKKKPTYIIEHAGAVAMRGIYEALWSNAAAVVKS